MSLFPPPKDVKTEIFARVPDEFRKSGGRPSWGEANIPGRDIDCFLEGPSFDSDGNLYLVNIPYGEIFKVTSSGKFSLVAQYDGWPNGLKVDREGNLIVADYKKGILKIDPKPGTWKHLLIICGRKAFVDAMTCI